jgi:hypothetical protein
MDAHGFVMVKAEPLPEGTPIVQGYDFNKVPRSLHPVLPLLLADAATDAGGWWWANRVWTTRL